MNTVIRENAGCPGYSTPVALPISSPQQRTRDLGGFGGDSFLAVPGRVSQATEIFQSYSTVPGEASYFSGMFMEHLTSYQVQMHECFRNVGEEGFFMP